MKLPFKFGKDKEESSAAKPKVVVGGVRQSLKDRFNPVMWLKSNRQYWPIIGTFGALVLYGLSYRAYLFMTPQQNLETTHQTIAESAQAVADTKDYDKAIAKALAARREAATQEGRFQATMSAAGWYLERRNYKEALFYYQDAEKLMPSEDVDVYLGIANSAAAQSKNDIAKQYFQKAIDYYSKDLNNNIDIVTHLETRLNSTD